MNKLCQVLQVSCHYSDRSNFTSITPFDPDCQGLTVQRGQIHSPLGISGSGGLRQWMW